MENARLLDDLRGRTRDLQESLEYQTATSDVLKVISQSGAELEPVLENLVETASRICVAEKGFIFRLERGLYQMVASFGFSPDVKDFVLQHPIAPGRNTLTGRVAIERRVVHINDQQQSQDTVWSEAYRLGEIRTALGVPLFRDETVVGVIALARSRVESFTEKQIA